MEPSILIIDDEQKMGDILARVLSKEGYDVKCTSDAREGVALIGKKPVQVILCDLKMPGMSGLEVLEQAKKLQPDADFIMMTAYATAQTAVEAMKKGAFDYLIKPFPMDELKLLLSRVLETRHLKEENQQLREVLEEKFSFENIVSNSAAMEEVLGRVRKVAGSNASVLLRGESGTGKEILARAIHLASSRRTKPLIKVNCGAIPETLLESELFGHVKGAFTGAVETRKGLFQAANGGTIFLDEIGDISPGLQIKLLRVLQEGEFQRVGDAETVKVDVRLITATNKNLEEALKEGTFRQDLYYRLNVVPILIPPLRDRRDDIPALIEHFIKKFHGGKKKLSSEAFELLLRYDWPGNIRELENAVEHAVVMGENEQIGIDDLPLSLQNFHQSQGGQDQPLVFDHLTLEEVEKRCLLNALKKTKGNQTQAARLLGTTRRTLGYRLKKYGLEDKFDAEDFSNAESASDEN